MNADNSNSNEHIEAQLRRALNAEAEMVNPAGDGLGQIRAGIEARRTGPWWRNPAVALAAAAVLGLAAAAGAVLLNDDGGQTDVVANEATRSPSPSPSPTATSPGESPAATASATEEPPRGAVNLPIYYVHDDGTAVRLYREFHSVSLIEGDRIRSALNEMFSEDAEDPDYTSLWSKQTRATRVTKQGDTAVVDLNQAATKANVGAEAAAVTLQQLVHTVTAADPSVKFVRLTVEGRSMAELWGHVAVGNRTLQRAPAVDVQGLVWLLSPGENEKVGPRVRIHGVGTAFEGTISWEVRKVGGTIVEKGFTQGGSNGTFAEFIDEVLLAPGTYEIRAFESSAEDGRPLHVDDKTFVVE